MERKGKFMSNSNKKRLLYKINQKNDALLPNSPLLMVYDNCVWEAFDVESAVSILLGDRYLTLGEDDKWIERVQFARSQVVLAISRNENLQVKDSRLGVIRLNYAVEEDHPEYQELEQLKGKEKTDIFVDNEKAFLLSLVKIGAISLLENANSFLLQPGRPEKDPIDNKFLSLKDSYNMDDLIKMHL